MNKVGRIDTECVNCDLCGRNERRQLYTMPDLRYWTSEQEYNVVECKNCGHRYLNPRPTDESLVKCYPAEYYSHRRKDVPKQRERYWRQAGYFRNRNQGRFLDIGCARGAFCETMIELGWDCYGMDFIDQPKTVLPKGLKFNSGSLEEIRYPDNYFDGISAWGVFEHILSPKVYFKECARILKAGGTFVIMVPNALSLWSRFSFKEDIPRHMHFFSKETIEKYADMVELEIVKCEFTNRIYSRPATGKDCFRINLLKLAGVPWRKINSPQERFDLKMLSALGSLLGRLLIHQVVEEYLGLSGIMVIEFTKN